MLYTNNTDSIEEGKKKHVNYFSNNLPFFFIEIHNNKGFIKISVVVTD